MNEFTCMIRYLLVSIASSFFFASRLFSIVIMLVVPFAKKGK